MPKQLAVRLIGGAAVEGGVEEMPQSIVEQIAQNVGATHAAIIDEHIGANDTVQAQFLLSNSTTPNRPDLASEWDGRHLSSHAGQMDWNHSTQHVDWELDLIDRALLHGGECVMRGDEACNGIDDDCDGMVDDGLGTTPCGVGACATSAKIVDPEQFIHMQVDVLLHGMTATQGKAK